MGAGVECFTVSPRFRTRVCLLVISFRDAVFHSGRVCPHTPVIKGVVALVPGIIPMTVVCVVIRIPVVVVAVVVMPVERSPGVPVDRVITPVP